MFFDYLNRRNVNMVNEIVATVLSLSVNSLLFWCIRTEKMKFLTGYKKMLYITCTIDFISTFLMSVSCIEFEFPAGYYVIIVNGPFRHLPRDFHYFLCLIYTFAVGIGTLNLPFNFYYRYVLVCKQRVLSFKEITTIIVFIGTYALFDSLCITSAFIRSETSSAVLDRYFNNSMWLEADGSQTKFIAANNRATGLILLLGFGTFIVFAEYAIVMVLRVLVMKEFSRNRCTMTVKTVKMHSIFNHILTVQAGVPILTCVLPLNAIFFVLATGIELEYLGSFVVGLMTYIPIVSPLSTLILVPTFRKRIKTRLRPKTAVEGNRGGSVMPTSTT